MLPRIALRAIRPSALPSNHLRRFAVPGIACLPSRTYASKPPSRPPPPPLGARPSPAPGPKQASRPTPPPPQQRPNIQTNPSHATGSARQTSPGTALPKDQTWKPKDTIRFAGPAAATASTAEAKDLRHGEQQRDAATEATTSIDGTRPESAAARQSDPLEEEGRAQEPLAQQADADEPLPGTVREEAHAKQAGSENTTPPPEAPSYEEELKTLPQGQQQEFKLPDLRQGIPSTFDFEFGGARKGQQKDEGMAAQQNSTDGKQPEHFDLTESTAEQSGSGRSGERGEREYTQKDYETSLDRRRARLANYAFLAALVGAVGGAAYFARPFGEDEPAPAGTNPDIAEGWAPGKMWNRVRARMGMQMGYYTEPTFPKLLPTVPENQRQPFTLVLSLEDLLIHTSWDRANGYRTAKRPGLDYFIRYLSQYYELVLFTSTPRAIADPVIAKLDPYHFIMWPLGREATKYENGEYVKDLEYLNRPLGKTLIIDTHAPHVKNQPENAVILPKWSGDPRDPHVKDLVALIPFLEYVATMGIDDVRTVLKSFEGKSIPEEFARREASAREKFNEQLAVERAKAPKRSLGSLFGNSLGIKGGPAPGGMVLQDGQSVAEGLAQGKMLSDQIREQGQKQYEHLEKQIREHGAQWLKEEEDEQKRLMEASMKEMKGSAFNWFGGAKKE